MYDVIRAMFNIKNISNDEVVELFHNLKEDIIQRPRLVVEEMEEAFIDEVERRNICYYCGCDIENHRCVNCGA